MSVKRYIATGTGMVVMRDGNCITYADYLKLEAERDALKELNGELVEALEEIIELYDPYTNAPTDKWMAEKAQAALNKAREVME